MEDYHLLHPLLPNTITAATVDVPTTTNPSDDDNIKLVSSNSKIILRLFFIVVVGVLSLWANHEASKGFQIKIQNNAAADSAASRQFDLLYVSNDKATRLVLKTSKFVETTLYPNPNTTQPKKQVNRVTLGLTSRNLTHMVMVESLKDHEFVLLLSPSIFMEETNVDHAMLRAVQNGMSRVWLYNNNAPKSLIDGMVEYISGLAGLGGGAAAEDFSGGGNQPESDNICWKDENPRAVARFLNYCEVYKKGFIQRLNQGMRVGWNDRTVEDAIGMPAQHLTWVQSFSGNGTCQYPSTSTSSSVLNTTNSSGSTVFGGGPSNPTGSSATAPRSPHFFISACLMIIMVLAKNHL